MFYRKQYLLGFLFLGIGFGVAHLLALNVALFVLLELVIWLVLKFVVALNARSIYVGKAVKNIREARTQQIPVREWDAHLQLIGGVSHLGGQLAIAFIVAEIIYSIAIGSSTT